MKRLAGLLTIVLLGAALAINASSGKPGQVQIARLDATNWDEFAPQGKEVDAIYGDFVLRNDHVVAVIAQPLASRNANMTVRDVGGCLIDLTVRWNQSDQLSAFYPGKRRFPYRSSSASAEGKTVELTDGAVSTDDGAITVRSAGAEGRPNVEVTYQLAADAKFVEVTSLFTNETSEAITVPLTDDMRVDARNEDIVKSPNGRTDLFWFHDQFWGQACAVEPVGLAVETNSNSRTSTLNYESDSIDQEVTLEPGKSFELTRRLYPGSDLPHVRAINAEINEQPLGEVEFFALDGLKRPIRDARVVIHRGEERWGLVVTGDDGLARTKLPVGKYSVKVEALGVDITPSSGDPTVAVGKKSRLQKLPMICDGWKPGTVNARITDGDGQPIPCKIEFLAKEGTEQPWYGPTTASFATNGLCYAAQGELMQTLPAGQFDVIISHGPEFDAIFTDITVQPGKTAELTGKLKRVVDTTGWISSDFHSHSSPSGDNTGSQLGRVLNLVCDHIEFAPCTEHNRVDSYQPHIDRLQIGQFISSCTGMELTGSPLLLNHQNAFPMIHRPHMQDGGGPVTDYDIERQVERLALWDDRSEKLVQVNHPDMGWLFRDKNGDGIADDGHARILPHIDVIEIHPIPDILTLDPFLTASKYKGNNRIFNWLQYLNQGQRFVGVVNTDAHYNYHESGWLRNWIKSPTDDPAAIKPLDVVRASEAGALVMSNGPFLDVKIREAGQKAAVIAGQDLNAPSGKVEIDVKVQCPNWLDVDRLFVLVNGRIHEPLHFRKATHPDRFKTGVVRFDDTLSLELKEDAHLIVAVGGEKSTLGKVHGPTWGQHHPAAFINPVVVDVDGGGFQPNGDTLGQPLPVRYGYPKK
ncbi:MAG: CehA/McbA family metallohydrolase [Planctomycetota bacterium]|jgi:hypothetical protein